jgi:hypothetical protein
VKVSLHTAQASNKQGVAGSGFGIRLVSGFTNGHFVCQQFQAPIVEVIPVNIGVLVQL